MVGPVVEVLRVKGWRSYAAAEIRLGPGLTVVHGPNGAGKTNLLEALYFGLTGRSCRTGNEREVVGFGASAARVEVDTRDRDGAHELAVGFQPGEAKRFRVDGAPVERLTDTPARPLVSVFLPDRLELVKGPPALRRAHLDQVVAALWPARVATRRAYSQALAQRNALLSRVRRGMASREALRVWDAEVARHGVALRADRTTAVASLVEPFAAAAQELGLTGEARLEERPKVRAAGADELAEELAAGVDSDLERGFTG
nr:AAA family ATPase [Actinomycetota bacterium]